MNNSSYTNFSKFKSINRIEPKRCFVTSQVIRNLNRGNQRYLPKLSHDEFYKRVQKAKNIVLNFSEKELDNHIIADSARYKRRLKTYNSVNWYRGFVYSNEVGVWKGAGGLPVNWTQGSLEYTSKLVNKALQDKEDKRVAARAKRAIPRIGDNLDIIIGEQYLYPIILPAATNGRGLYGKPYKQFQLMKGDIDDGCMRAIAIINSGKTSFNAFIGIKQFIR